MPAMTRVWLCIRHPLQGTEPWRDSLQVHRTGLPYHSLQHEETCLKDSARIYLSVMHLYRYEGLQSMRQAGLLSGFQASLPGLTATSRKNSSISGSRREFVPGLQDATPGAAVSPGLILSMKKRAPALDMERAPFSCFMPS